MKTLFLLFFVTATITGCKKAIQNLEEDALTIAITNGQWKVTNFIQGSNNVTTDFAEYRFQFLKNRTVDAIKNGSVNASGTWQAHPETRSIASDFKNSQHPLPLLNGMWVITNNSWTFVEARKNINNETYTLRLDKI